ncbi:MAG: hypothetical protein AMS24_04580 [Chlamydiae bacterium SM23_39]|nr:MAG: hypothetical protein AMS24_04580 [Chlamydiae bacterium SM23_39]
MLNLVKVAVTGDIAAGKSTVCRYFKKFKTYVIDTDKVVHKLLSSNAFVMQRVIKLLGKKILRKGKIDRKKISEKVFNDRKKLRSLEKIICPYLWKELKERYEREKKRGKNKIFMVEMPLLFETKSEKFFDYIILISAEEKFLKERYKKKDFEKRRKRFMNIEKKIKKSDFVIFNNSTLKDLKKEIQKIKKEIFIYE